jgi:hypothetical protein
MIEYDRSDHPVPPEAPHEAQVVELEKVLPPRPFLKMIGPIIFFAECKAGEGGCPIFLEVGVAACDEWWGWPFFSGSCWLAAETFQRNVGRLIDPGITILYAQNASSGFALRTYPDPESRSRSLPEQRARRGARATPSRSEEGEESYLRGPTTQNRPSFHTRECGKEIMPEKIGQMNAAIRCISLRCENVIFLRIRACFA